MKLILCIIDVRCTPNTKRVLSISISVLTCVCSSETMSEIETDLDSLEYKGFCCSGALIH